MVNNVIKQLHKRKLVCYALFYNFAVFYKYYLLILLLIRNNLLLRLIIYLFYLFTYLFM